MSLAYRIVFSAALVWFGLSVLAGLGYGVVEEGGLPSFGRGASPPTARELRVQAVLQPRNANVLASVAVALETRGDSQGAIEFFLETLKIDPSASNIHARLAALYQRSGRNAEARAQAQLAARKGVPLDPATLRALGIQLGGER